MTAKKNDADTPSTSPGDLEARAENRSHRPTSKSFREFMASGWGERPPADFTRGEVADFLPARHRAVSEPFVGQRLVIPAGTLKTRASDTDHRFRADSGFIYLTGLTGEREPEAVLVLEPVIEAGEGEDTHRAVLYFEPRAPRSSEQFYADSRYGEFWVGARPSLEQMESVTGLKAAPIGTLREALAKDSETTPLRVLRGVDDSVEGMVEEVRRQAGQPAGDAAAAPDSRLAEHLSEVRLVKDEFEIGELQYAVDVTKRGFERIIRALPRAVQHPLGERVLEGAFASISREEGNGLGYETIIAAGNNANTLHWTDNSGSVPADSLVLIDAGVEVDSLYTGDLTRTLPASGTFSPVQEKIYQAVLDAAEAALRQAGTPGTRYRDIHGAAMEVIAQRLEEWGILPVSARESLRPSGQQHRRWMPHGTGHHLGLDVHDGGQARPEAYQEATLKPGMVFTIEPGLYFRADDLTVPEEFRGIGVRIEDNIVIEKDGSARRLSESVPRTPRAVEQWIRSVQSGAGADEKESAED